MANEEAMTLGIFIGTIVCTIVAVGAIIGCLVFLYKSGEEHCSIEGDKFTGSSLFCGAVAVAAIFGVFALTRNIVWAFLI